MNPTAAIRALQDLKDEMNAGGVSAYENKLTSWRARVRAVFQRSLGENNDLVQKLDDTWFSPGVYYEGQPESDFADARRSGSSQALAYIDAAMYELGLIGGEDTILEAASYDRGLWDHVSGLVDSEDWALLAASVAIYVEDSVRRWSGLPASLVGKGLYAKAFANDGVLRLGLAESEWEGWRGLGMGLAQALGNVDRHRVQRRTDEKAYAIGVLGLGSLLLTQLHWEHEDLIVNVDER